MPDFDYQLSVEASAEDRNAIERGLELYNERFIGADHYKPIHIVMRDEAGAIVGGLIGGTYWNWLYIRIMWVSEDCRKSGAGTRLLEMAESEAIQRGCKNAHVDTFDFQALGFYNKRGYTVWGRLDAFAGDYTRYFLRKQLGTG